jgi:hypothetical protein
MCRHFFLLERSRRLGLCLAVFGGKTRNRWCGHQGFLILSLHFHYLFPPISRQSAMEAEPVDRRVGWCWSPRAWPDGELEAWGGHWLVGRHSSHLQRASRSVMGGWRDRDEACELRLESVRQGQAAGGGAQSTWSAALFNHAATSVCSSQVPVEIEGGWRRVLDSSYNLRDEWRSTGGRSRSTGCGQAEARSCGVGG